MTIEQGPDTFKHPEVGDTQPDTTSNTTRIQRLKITSSIWASTLLSQPEVPDELPEVIQYDEDGNKVTHYESPELVGSNTEFQSTVVVSEKDINHLPTTETKH